MNLSPYRIDDSEGHQMVADVVHGTVESSEAIPGYLATAAIIAQGSGSGGAVLELSGSRCAVVATGPCASVSAVLVDIQTRIADGQATPVLASHLDALGLRDAVEAWARAQ